MKPTPAPWRSRALGRRVLGPSIFGILLGAATAVGQGPSVPDPADEQDTVITEFTTHTAYPTIESSYDFHPQIQQDPMEPTPRVVPIRKLPIPEGQSADDRDFRPSPRDYGFNGIGNTGWNPPDPTLAVGPGHIITTVNSTIAWYTKSGTLQFSAPLGSQGNPGFFEGVGAGSFVFDPKCVYDEGSGRYFVLGLEVYSSSAWITFGVSDDSDPNGTWYKYRTDAVTTVGGQDYWVDYPGLGFSADAFVVVGNLFGFTSGFAGVKYRVIEKSQILSGGAAVYHDLRDGGAASAQVASVHGASLGAFVVSVQSSTSIKLQAVTDETTSPTITTRNVTVPSFSSPPAAPNQGGGTLDTLDGRIINADYRGTRLVAGHGIEGPFKTSASRWYEFDTNNWPNSGSPTLVQSGSVELAKPDFLWYPSIAIGSDGDLEMVMAHSQDDFPAGVLYTRQEPGDPSGSMQGPWPLRGGEGGSSGRWGDYFDIAVDPVDDDTMWGVGEYVNSSGSWRTFIDELTYEFTLPNTGFLFSVRDDGVLGGIPVDDGDILYYDPSADEYDMVLDIRDVVDTNVDVDALIALPDGSLLISFIATENVVGLVGGPNGDVVEDEDIIRFIPTRLGADSVGSWEFYFDGSDVGLDLQKHDIDSMSLDDSGNLLVSLIGPWDLGGGFAGKDEDILLFSATSLGANTSGTFSMFFDASDSDVRLASNGEDIDSFHFDDANDEISVTTFGDHRVPNVGSGQGNDIIVFAATQFGSDPAGTWTLFFDGANFPNLGQIDALHRLD